MKKYYGCLFYIVLIAIVAGMIVSMEVDYRRKVDELEEVCIGAEFDGMAIDDNGVYYCHREVGKVYEVVLVKVVQYYNEEKQ